jgi:release factor glutamine methyltransferase
VTVIQVIQRSTDFLAKKGVDSPRLQVELLLAHLLKLPRMGLYLNFERVLNEAEMDNLRQLVVRRGEREPLQHIVGSTSFCGVEMQVSPAVLIPRPETELLAEQAWKFLGGLPAGASAFDFGTGSGCLAVVLALKCPAAKITAVDVSPEALEVAKKNAAANHVEERVEFRLGDGFRAVAGEQFDLIVSNPPYIPGGEITSLEPEVRDHDPRLALDGGADGLDFYRILAAESAAFLRKNGRVMLELGHGQDAAVSKLFQEQMWIVEAVLPDYNGVPRILKALRPD